MKVIRATTYSITLASMAFLFVFTTSLSARAQNIQDDYAMAAGYYTRGQWDEAADAFENLIQSYPTTEQAVLARFYAAEVMMQRGQFPEGFRAFQKFLVDFPDHKLVPRSTFRMGEAAYRIDNFEVALRMLEEFVTKNPFHELTEFALPYLGEMRLKREEPQLSQRAFETALKMYPGSRLSNSCRLGLAKAFQAQGLNSEAERFYQFLMSQNDCHHSGEAKLQMGILSFGKRDFASAESYLVDSMKTCPSPSSKAESTYWLARTHIEIDNCKQAVALFKTIDHSTISENLGASALFDGAVAADRCGNDKQAIYWLSQLRKSYPHNTMVDDALRMEIDLRQKQGQTDKALALIREFRTHHHASPMQASVLETEGRTHYAEKRFEQSIDTFAMLISQHGNAQETKNSDVATWLYLKSLGHLGLGDFDGSEMTLGRINESAQTEILKPLVQMAWATTYYGKENYHQAAIHYRKYLSLLPEGPEAARARTELTVSLAELGRWEQSSTVFDELTRRHENHSEITPTVRYLAEKAYQENQIPFAEQWFTYMANSNQPKEVVARGLSGLAWIKMEASDDKAAYPVFERLLTEFPESKFSGEAAMARAKYLEDQGLLRDAAQMYGLVIRRFGKTKMASIAMLRRAHCFQKIGDMTNLLESKTLLTDYLNQTKEPALADEARYQLAWLLHDLGQPAEGRDQFRILFDRYPASKYWPDATYRLAQHAATEQNRTKAYDLLDRLIACNSAPEMLVTRGLFLKGQIAAGEKQWETVERSMQKIVVDDLNEPLNIKAKYWLAESRFRQKKYRQAIQDYDGLVNQLESVESKLRPWVLLRAAQSFANENDWLRAAKIATQGQNSFPDFPAAFEFEYVIGRALEDAGKLTDAREHYEKVIESKQGGSTETAAIAQWRIGETYFHQEEYVQAIKAYYRVHSLFSYEHWRSAALIQAGKCQEHLRKNKHAMKLYLQLLKDFPNSQFADEAQTRIDQLTRQARLQQKSRVSATSKSR